MVFIEKMNYLAKLVFVESSSKNGKELIFTAGFSKAAFEHCMEMIKRLLELDGNLKIFAVQYDSSVSLKQAQICERKDRDAEQELALQLATDIYNQCYPLQIKNPHVIAKSAGGSVAINLAQIMELQTLSLFAPAYVPFRKMRIIGKPAILVGWNDEDPRIPMLPNMELILDALKSMCDIVIVKKIYKGNSHDFNPDFIVDARNQNALQ